LGETLLGRVVAELPSGIERLVIVSDGAIHRLPFEALRVDANPRTLGERFDLTLVPSATLWLQLRSSELPASAKRTLVFADPDGPRTSPDGERPLARLPWARREAHAIAKTLALDSRDVLEGDAATEHTLKNATLSEFAVLHFAAHARADEAFPDRSAVFLAAGDADEDGWLQPREIDQFDLRGRLVVLSACESAHGRVLSGEGPLSLARAFFAAGASGVVATRWPLRDDDAAFMMERFYRRGGRRVARHGCYSRRLARQEAHHKSLM
jgi:CHAT domain-containing protein